MPKCSKSKPKSKKATPAIDLTAQPVTTGEEAEDGGAPHDCMSLLEVPFHSSGWELAMPIPSRCARLQSTGNRSLTRCLVSGAPLFSGCCMSEEQPMDGHRYLQPDNAARSGRYCHRIMSHKALGDARQTGACADRVRLRR